MLLQNLFDRVVAFAEPQLAPLVAFDEDRKRKQEDFLAQQSYEHSRTQVSEGREASSEIDGFELRQALAHRFGLVWEEEAR